MLYKYLIISTLINIVRTSIQRHRHSCPNLEKRFKRYKYDWNPDLQVFTLKLDHSKCRTGPMRSGHSRWATRKRSTKTTRRSGPSGISSTRSRKTKEGADDDPPSTPPPCCDGIRPPFVSGLGAAAFAHVTGFDKAPRVTTLEGFGWMRVSEVPGRIGLWAMWCGTTESA